MGIRAVIWDFGGVLTTSPFEAFRRYEEANGLPPGFIRQVNATDADDNAWAKLERSEVDLAGFAELFEAEAAAAGHRVDGLAILGLLGGDLRPEMVTAVRRCQEELTTALLTNNFVPAAVGEAPPRDAARATGALGTATRSGGPMAEVLELFDVVVESSRVGVRKPDPAIYELVCERLDVDPSEAAFLDDLGVNLKPARALGMTTIKVADPAAALAELEAAVGFPLR